MNRPLPLLWLALGALGLLWAWTRTPSGRTVTASVIDETGRIVGKVIDMTTARGLRNNNPGNIERTGDRWRGMSTDQSADERFVVFDSPVWGLRAMARVLRKYAAGGAVTVRAIINRWAPPTENITSAYVAAVARELNVDPDTPLVLDAVMPELLAAITRHENGTQPYNTSTIAEAIRLEQSA